MSCFTNCISALRGTADNDTDIELDGAFGGSSKWQRVRRNSFEADDTPNVKYALAGAEGDDEDSPNLNAGQDIASLRRRLKHYEDVDFLRTENKALKRQVHGLQAQVVEYRRKLGLPEEKGSPAFSQGTPEGSPPLISLDAPLSPTQTMPSPRGSLVESMKASNATLDTTLDTALATNGTATGDGNTVDGPADEETLKKREVKAAVRVAAASLTRLATEIGEWKKGKEKGGITLYTCKIPGTNSLGVKVVSTFEFSAQEAYETLMDKETKLGDSEYKVVVPMDDGFRVTYTRVPIPIPLMSDSDFCCGEWAGDADGAKVYAFTSVQHPACPPARKSIRGKIVVGGWYIVPAGPASCEATMISICDPCRMLPSAFAQSTAEKSGKSMVVIKKLVLARRERMAKRRAAEGKSMENGFH